MITANAEKLHENIENQISYIVNITLYYSKSQCQRSRNYIEEQIRSLRKEKLGYFLTNLEKKTVQFTYERFQSS